MGDPPQDVKFEPVRLWIAGGWCVHVTLPHGHETQIGAFRTEAEAKRWIAENSAGWLKDYDGGKYA